MKTFFFCVKFVQFAVESGNNVGIFLRCDIKHFNDADISHFEWFTFVAVRFIVPISCIILPAIPPLLQSNRPNEIKSKQKETHWRSSCLSLFD